MTPNEQRAEFAEEMEEHFRPDLSPHTIPPPTTAQQLIGWFLVVMALACLGLVAFVVADLLGRWSQP